MYIYIIYVLILNKLYIIQHLHLKQNMATKKGKETTTISTIT